MAMLMIALAGCHVVGPSGIRSGRGAYAAAINATNNQQTLLSIVKLRYGETWNMLAVSSVTANMKFASRGSFDIGVGPEQNYAGNLVPLSGSVAYEENPTISYRPIDGGDFVRELLSAIPLRLFLLLLESGDIELKMRMLTESVNDIRNPDLGGTPPDDNRFDRLIEIAGGLDRAGMLDWGQSPGNPDEIVAVVYGYDPNHTPLVQELLAILEMPPERANGRDIVVPLYLGAGTPRRDSVKIRTRSIFDLLRVAAASAEVPPEHTTSGLAIQLTVVETDRGLVRIRSSKKAPKEAAVAVKHRDHWFYIEATDRNSRLAFHLIQTLVSVRIADVAGGAVNTPILTVPVSQ